MQDFPIGICAKSIQVAGDLNAEKAATLLEAWINFEALKVGWFADESQIISLQCKIIPLDAFSQQLKNQQSNMRVCSIDDAQQLALFYCKTQQCYFAYIAHNTSVSITQGKLKFKLHWVANQLAQVVGLSRLNSL
ncbi:hypothetical protein [Catenovulum sediminis]|uniref:hypothetical protein n=1 Tax=Catenovulum sediminis TaxID=1740262 RepID=UPI0011814EB9|nr:hypothetical protein [Catenovulum sediminis]